MRAAITQGANEAEALKNINEVVHIIVDELTEDGIAPLTSELWIGSERLRLVLGWMEPTLPQKIR
jgi:hypothetical protein